MRKIIQFISVLSVVALLACYVTAEAKKRSNRKQNTSTKVPKTQKYSVPDISNLTDFYNQVKKSGKRGSFYCFLDKCPDGAVSDKLTEAEDFVYPFLGYKDSYVRFTRPYLQTMDNVIVLIYFNDYNEGINALHKIESSISKRYGQPLESNIYNNHDESSIIGGFTWNTKKNRGFISCVFELNADYQENMKAYGAYERIYDIELPNTKYVIYIIFDPKNYTPRQEKESRPSFHSLMTCSTSCETMPKNSSDSSRESSVR